MKQGQLQGSGLQRPAGPSISRPKGSELLQSEATYTINDLEAQKQVRLPAREPITLSQGADPHWSHKEDKNRIWPRTASRGRRSCTRSSAHRSRIKEARVRRRNHQAEPGVLAHQSASPARQAGPTSRSTTTTSRHPSGLPWRPRASCPWSDKPFLGAITASALDKNDKALTDYPVPRLTPEEHHQGTWQATRGIFEGPHSAGPAPPYIRARRTPLPPPLPGRGSQAGLRSLVRRSTCRQFAPSGPVHSTPPDPQAATRGRIDEHASRSLPPGFRVSRTLSHPGSQNYGAKLSVLGVIAFQLQVLAACRYGRFGTALGPHFTAHSTPLTLSCFPKSPFFK